MCKHQPVSFPFVAACLGIALVAACSRGKEAESPVAATTLITVAEANASDVNVVLTSMGRLESRASPAVAAEVDGRVLRLMVDAGDGVAIGSVLAELDATTLKLELQAARAEIARIRALLVNEQRRVERLRNLQIKGSISREQFDDAEAGLAVLRAQRDAIEARLHIVEDQLAKTVIRAPLAGRIQKRLVSPGDFVKRGNPLFEIATSDRLRALLPFPESIATQLAAGLAVKLSSPLAPEESATGIIAELRPAVGEANRAVWAIVDIDNPGTWRPYATVRAEIRVATHANAVVVPAQSLVRRPAGEVVYVISAGRALQRVVMIGERFDGRVEILDGIAHGDTIALDGAAYLSDGAPVRLAGTAP